MPIQSFIGEYLSQNGYKNLVNEYGLEPFSIRVQSLSRTLVDKVFADLKKEEVITSPVRCKWELK